MPKNDYIMLANLINKGAMVMREHNFTNHTTKITHILKYGNFINALCTELVKDNPKFNEDKFRVACGEVLAKWQTQNYKKY